MQLTDKDIGTAIATFESSGPTDTNGHYPKGHDKNSGIYMEIGGHDTYSPIPRPGRK
jgi:hypothetical protein